MNLLLSLNDGRLSTASFDMLLDILAITMMVSTHAKYFDRCHYLSENNRFLA